MKRREFITMLGGAAAGWPIGTRAQQAGKFPVIGFLLGQPVAEIAYLLPGFRSGLGEAGFVEGQNVTFEYMSAAFKFANLPALASGLVDRHVSVIVTIGSTGAAQ